MTTRQGGPPEVADVVPREELLRGIRLASGMVQHTSR
jgi:hypothetical protein